MLGRPSVLVVFWSNPPRAGGSKEGIEDLCNKLRMESSALSRPLAFAHIMQMII